MRGDDGVREHDRRGRARSPRRGRGPTRRRRPGAARRASPRPRRPRARAPRGPDAGRGPRRGRSSNGTRSARSSASSAPLAAKKSASGGALSPQEAGRSAPGEQRAEVHPLVRQRRRALLGRRQLAPVRAVEVDRALLEEPHVLAPARDVVADRGQQRAEQRRAHLREVLGERVAQPHRGLDEPQLALHLGRLEAPADRLGEARADERVGRAPAQLLLGRQPPAHAVAGDRRRELLQPPQPRDLLDQVDLARDVVAAERRHGHVEVVAAVGDAELEPLEQLGLLAERDLGAEQPRDLLVAQPQRLRRRALRRRRRPCPAPAARRSARASAGSRRPGPTA